MRPPTVVHIAVIHFIMKHSIATIVTNANEGVAMHVLSIATEIFVSRHVTPMHKHVLWNATVKPVNRIATMVYMNVV